MKQVIYVLIALIAVGMASAVTVDCGQDKWYDWDAGDCVANELQPTFDEVTGMIDDIDVTIANNNEAWLAGDGRGTSFTRVAEYLYNDFVDFLKTIFVTRAEFESLEDKYYDLMAEGNFNQAVLLEMADKNTDVVEHNGYRCVLGENSLVCLG